MLHARGRFVVSLLPSDTRLKVETTIWGLDSSHCHIDDLPRVHGDLRRNLYMTTCR